MDVDSDCVIVHPYEENVKDVYPVIDVSSTELCAADYGKSCTSEQCYPTPATDVSAEQIEPSNSLTSTSDQVLIECEYPWILEFVGSEGMDFFLNLLGNQDQGNTADESQNDIIFSSDVPICNYNSSPKQLIPTDSILRNSSVQEGCGVYPVNGGGTFDIQAPVDHLRSGTDDEGSSLYPTAPVVFDIGVSHTEKSQCAVDWVSALAPGQKLSSDGDGTELVDVHSAHTEDQVEVEGEEEDSDSEDTMDADQLNDYDADTEDNVDDASRFHQYQLSHGDIVLASESLLPPFSDVKDDENRSSMGNVLGVVVNPGSEIFTEQFIYCRETGESGGLEIIKKHASLPVTEMQRPEYKDQNMIAVCSLQEPSNWAFVSPSFLKRAKDKDLTRFGHQKIDVRIYSIESSEIDQNLSSDSDASFITNSIQVPPDA